MSIGFDFNSYNISLNGQYLTTLILYNKTMIDPEMLAAILQELGYLDEDDESNSSKYDLLNLLDSNSENPREDEPDNKE